jgi:hypothetical protein
MSNESDATLADLAAKVKDREEFLKRVAIVAHTVLGARHASASATEKRVEEVGGGGFSERRSKHLLFGFSFFGHFPLSESIFTPRKISLFYWPPEKERSFFHWGDPEVLRFTFHEETLGPDIKVKKFDPSPEWQTEMLNIFKNWEKVKVAIRAQAIEDEVEKERKEWPSKIRKKAKDLGFT